ncbi:M16 family metallopeptidase [Tuwongella immobilis]|uniref:Peptidase M16 N-terminal domain-containing protein n=1 Tax=Tuwongella immobilis TaxID=692036 RepID=A0A6C2YTI6_9BACT|nr:pitrilysin family protein [Tuwongella immobilis]VIP04786.1 peptidase m16 : Zinc protease OS=Planctomyces maris DSM 8797 GN=PM8797T_30591 PE=3 SV=1: Peptidase_M16: Peptidase_M16_C [Tuwongella immobilis]VTS06931.1 peptidase m16 : Zinc protease OS=Planctomyces maris DSM 8797 GN=PM8797T_30591 PE=3 SV=1: Peptidase_M16: Peptidase_M16_C [Tuwongella immobilis]
MPFHSHRLANGLQLIGETHPSMRSVAVGFFVRTGSRDEQPQVAGVSHFLEHMMFKGTPRRTALDVNLDFDRIGASYNAYTSEENTVYYASILPEYLPKAVDILADILRPSLRGDDFDMEKKVIIEEIGMYDDQPMWVAYDHARKFHYGDHPLGNTVLGSVESVGALTPEQMREYFQSRYVASNIVVSVAGNFDWDEFVRLVEAACSDWPQGNSDRTHRVAAPVGGGVHTLTKDKLNQAYAIRISSGPASESMQRYAGDTLALALGDDTGSRLYWALVDPGLADSADVSYYEYDHSGTFFVTLTCPPAAIDSNLAIVEKVLAEVQAEGITAEELDIAKTKIASRVVRSAERPMGRMQSIASAWTYTGEYRDVDTELSRYDAVTLEQVRQVLDEFPLTVATTLRLLPPEGSTEESEESDE